MYVYQCNNILTYFYNKCFTCWFMLSCLYNKNLFNIYIGSFRWGHIYIDIVIVIVIVGESM